MNTFAPPGDTLHDNNHPVEETEIIDVANAVFVELFGEDMASQSKPLFLKNRTLTVSCSTSASAENIRENQTDIVMKINDTLGKKEVDRIRYLA